MGVNNTFACYREDSIGSYLFYSIVLISVIIIFKSIFVIIMTCRPEARQKNLNMVFASMAINEFVVAVALIYYQVETIPFYKFYVLWNNTATSFIFGCCYGSVQVSLMHMSLLAFDSYIHILHPFYYMKYVTKRRVFVTLLSLWIVGLTFIFTPIFIYTDNKFHEKCIILHPPVEYFGVSSCAYSVMLIATCVCYFKIASLPFKRRKAAIARRMNAPDIGDKGILKFNRTSAFRSVKFFVLMFGVLAMCTFPIVVMVVLGCLFNLTDDTISSTFFLLPTYSVINIFIYIKINRDFYRLIQSSYFIFGRMCLLKNRQ